ncbi:MAG: HNH endonuclease [Dehalococcoidia bacterium]
MTRSDQVISLYQTGLTLREVAERIGASPESVRRALIAAGVKRRSRGVQPTPGSRIRDKDGYILVRQPAHPNATSSGYIREHRLVLERTIGRYLEPQEVVHHLDGDKANNTPENLRLYPSNAAHKREDMRGNSWAKGDFGNPKRRHRVRRDPHQILSAIRWLAVELDRPIVRKDLVPPHPSYRAVARAFGSWQEGVELALSCSCPSGCTSLLRCESRAWAA